MILRVCLTTFLLLQNTINFDLFKFYNFTEEWKFIKLVVCLIIIGTIAQLVTRTYRMARLAAE